MSESDLSVRPKRTGICLSCGLHKKGQEDDCEDFDPRTCCCDRWKARAGVREVRA